MTSVLPFFKVGGAIAGRFRILRRLGNSEDKAVFAVEQIGAGGKRFALKIANRADVEASQRLREEFLALAGMEHRNLVKVYELGEDNSFVWYTMDLIKGGTLESVIKSNFLLLGETIELFRQLLYAVAFLHEKRIVHRDLKPANVLVEDGGRVVIIDLGICRAPGRRDVTGEEFTGTLEYVSPERAAIAVGDEPWSSRHEADSPAADVYSLGVILYYLLSGEMPHGKPGETPAQRTEFLRHVAHVRPARSDFAHAGLGAVAMTMLRPIDQGRPADALAAMRLFEDASQENVKDDFSPLCVGIIQAEIKANMGEAKEVPREGERVVSDAAQRAVPPACQVATTYVPPDDVSVMKWGMAAAVVMFAIGGVALFISPTQKKVPEVRAVATLETASLPEKAGALDDSIIEKDHEPGAEVWAELPLATGYTSGVPSDLMGFLLNVNLITGPVPGQKRYPCNAAKKQIPFKGGCWRIFSLEGATREERVAECKTSKGYEPSPGWCEKAGGFIYWIIFESEEAKPPSQAYGPDFPGVEKDPKGYDHATGETAK